MPAVQSVNAEITEFSAIGVARGGITAVLPKFIAYLVVLCSERRCPKPKILFVLA